MTQTAAQKPLLQRCAALRFGRVPALVHVGERTSPKPGAKGELVCMHEVVVVEWSDGSTTHLGPASSAEVAALAAFLKAPVSGNFSGSPDDPQPNGGIASAFGAIRRTMQRLRCTGT